MEFANMFSDMCKEYKEGCSSVKMGEVDWSGNVRTNQLSCLAPTITPPFDESVIEDATMKRQYCAI